MELLPFRGALSPEVKGALTRVGVEILHFQDIYGERTRTHLGKLTEENGAVLLRLNRMLENITHALLHNGDLAQYPQRVTQLENAIGEAQSGLIAIRCWEDLALRTINALRTQRAILEQLVKTGGEDRARRS